MPGWTRVPGSWHGLGPGNTNLVLGGWVPGIVPSRHPPSTPPRVVPLPRTHPHRTTRTAVVTARCGTLGSGQGDPRGRIRTLHGGRSIPPRTSTAGTLLIDLAAGPLAPTGPHSQYFSVFLSISGISMVPVSSIQYPVSSIPEPEAQIPVSQILVYIILYS